MCCVECKTYDYLEMIGIRQFVRGQHKLLLLRALFMVRQHNYFILLSDVFKKRSFMIIDQENSIIKTEFLLDA